MQITISNICLAWLCDEYFTLAYPILNSYHGHHALNSMRNACCMEYRSLQTDAYDIRFKCIEIAIEVDPLAFSLCVTWVVLLPIAMCLYVTGRR